MLNKYMIIAFIFLVLFMACYIVLLSTPSGDGAVARADEVPQLESIDFTQSEVKIVKGSQYY